MNIVRRFSSSSLARANYGFIGLGQMGHHMARHINANLETGDKLYVYDINDENYGKFAESAPNEHTKLLSVGSFSTTPLDFIVTMVPEGKHVKAIVLEIVSDLKTPTTFLDCSTIDIKTSTEVHDLVKLKGSDFIDTPVSGGVKGARNATLAFMLSRDSNSSITPELNKLLLKMGLNIFACGDKHGSGLAAKLSNNYLLAITNLAVADSFQLAKSFGLNLQDYAKLVSVSTGKSWASVDNCPIPGIDPNLPCENDYNGGFITKLTRKDLVLATHEAKNAGRFLYLGDLGKYWYDRACENDEVAHKDLGVLFKWLGTFDEESGHALLKKWNSED